MARRRDSSFPTDVLRILLNHPDGTEQASDLFGKLGRAKWDLYKIHGVQQLEGLLFLYPEVFVVENARGPLPASVKATTRLALCEAHSNVSGSCKERGCCSLHLCIFFLLSGECSYRGKCFFGHDLSTPHNRRLLEAHFLSGLAMTELRALLCLPWVRRGVTVPQVCRYYNIKSGCTKMQSCRRLHLCRCYVLDVCKFAKDCKRNHDINNEQVTKVLNMYGVKVKGRRLTDMLAEVRGYERSMAGSSDGPALDPGRKSARPFGSVPNLFNGLSLSASPARHAGEGGRARQQSGDRRQRQQSESSYSALTRDHASQQVEEICLYNLTGNCRFRAKCNHLHCEEPYLWRITSVPLREAGPEVTWRDLDPESSDQLELSYSDPSVVQCEVLDTDSATLRVNFRDFTAEEVTKKGHRNKFTLRRLSTPSSGDASSKHLPVALATVWLWYWRNHKGDWNEFGLEKELSQRLPTTSQILECHYLTTRETPMILGDYVVDFGAMRLKNLKLNRKFKVRRRPQPFLRDGGSLESVSGSEMSDQESVEAEDDGVESVGEESTADNEETAADVPSEINGTWPFDVVPNNVSTAGECVGASWNGAGASGDKVAPTNGYLVKSRARDAQYRDVLRHFTSTLGKACDVLSIHKVNNSMMASAFSKKRSKLSRKSRQLQLLLYFAPQPTDDVDILCERGIDCSTSHGACPEDMTLGKGGYFHVNACKADKSIKGDARDRIMFVAECLVGTAYVGVPDLTAPPPRYDSCTDDLERPRTYVIFDGSRVCLKFLITYRLKKT